MIWLVALYLGSPPVPPGPVLPPGSDSRATPSTAQRRQERFLDLLASYPQRPPQETFRQAGQLVEEGAFEGRARAEYWIGSASLATGDLDGARSWFDRLSRDYPGSPWEERGWVGLGDAAALERDYGAALHWYARGAAAGDAAVRELSRTGVERARLLQLRQRAARAAGLLFALVVGFFAWSTFRARGALRPLPFEARIFLPVLVLLALVALRVDPAPRAAILQICAGGALLTLLSGLRLRAVRPAPLPHALLALGALACLAYLAVYRNDLVGLVAETFRAGPE